MHAATAPPQQGRHAGQPRMRACSTQLLLVDAACMFSLVHAVAVLSNLLHALTCCISISDQRLMRRAFDEGPHRVKALVALPHTTQCHVSCHANSPLAAAQATNADRWCSSRLHMRINSCILCTGLRRPVGHASLHLVQGLLSTAGGLRALIAAGMK